MTLHIRWLGRVPYREALAVQQAMFANGHNDHLLLLEHPHVFTHGPRADLAANLRVEPASVNAELVSVKRGGDVTYHGPGQLVGYPIVNVSNALGAADHVCTIQRVLVATLQELGVDSDCAVAAELRNARLKRACTIAITAAGLAVETKSRVDVGVRLALLRRLDSVITASAHGAVCP